MIAFDRTRLLLAVVAAAFVSAILFAMTASGPEQGSGISAATEPGDTGDNGDEASAVFIPSAGQITFGTSDISDPVELTDSLPFHVNTISAFDISSQTWHTYVHGAPPFASTLGAGELTPETLIWIARSGVERSDAVSEHLPVVAPPSLEGAHALPPPPPGGITVGSSGAGSLLEFVDAQSVTIASVMYFDVERQRSVSHVVGAPDFVNTLGETHVFESNSIVWAQRAADDSTQLPSGANTLPRLATAGSLDRDLFVEPPRHDPPETLSSRSGSPADADTNSPTSQASSPADGSSSGSENASEGTAAPEQGDAPEDAPSATSASGSADIPAGTYDVSLWLRPVHGSLHSDPRYSIRTANSGTWDASTGHNRLNHQIEIGEGAGDNAHVEFDVINDTFLNPGRGAYQQHEFNGDPIPASLINEHRDAYDTNLISLQPNLVDFRHTDTISPGFLNALDQSLTTMREHGFKVIIRVKYDAVGSDANDVEFSRMAQHIEQLAPVLNANKDVIQHYEAGFVGKWGEWHGSTNYGSGWWPESNWTELPNVLQKIMDEIEDRPVLLRYPRHVQYMINEGGEPRISAAHLPRLGLHNDSWLASADEWGTYEEEFQPGGRDFVLRWIPGRAMSGEHEFNDADPNNYTMSDIRERFEQFEHFQWNSIRSHHVGVTDMWRESSHPTEPGTYWDEMMRRLGYRIELHHAEMPNSVAVGEAIPLELRLQNTGWGHVVGDYEAVIVLQNESSPSDEHHFILDVDPGDWPAGGGDVVLSEILGD